MWLTGREVALELRISSEKVKSLRKSGWLTAIKLGRDYRYKIPPLPEVQIPHIETVNAFSLREVAEILGIQRETAKQLVKRHHLPGVRVGKNLYFSIADIRRVIKKRERRKGEVQYSPLLAEWLREYLEKGYVSAETLDKLLRQAVHLKTQAKSRTITLLWAHFDKINEILEAAKPDHRPVDAVAEQSKQ